MPFLALSNHLQPPLSVDELVSDFNNSTSILDLIAPVRYKKKTPSPCPWLSKDLRLLKSGNGNRTSIVDWTGWCSGMISTFHVGDQSSNPLHERYYFLLPVGVLRQDPLPLSAYL